MVEGDADRGIEAVAPNLRTWENLNDHTAIFQTPETAPKGRLVACPVAAWQCMDQERTDGLGLNYHNVVLGSETAHWAELEGAYKRGEPILVYAWEPHWVHAKFDMVEITLPDYNDDAGRPPIGRKTLRTTIPAQLSRTVRRTHISSYRT